MSAALAVLAIGAAVLALGLATMVGVVAVQHRRMMRQARRY